MFNIKTRNPQFVLKKTYNSEQILNGRFKIG